MKPTSFIPVVKEILPGEVDLVPDLGPVISHWTEDGYSAEEWFEELQGVWGNAGFAIRRGEEVSSFAVYGPLEYLPRAERFPVGPLREEAVLLAYVGGDSRSRRHLLVRVLRDLRLRGFTEVEGIASDFGMPWHVSTRFLLESGWRPVRQGWRRGASYTLARTDLGSTVEVGELARGLIGRVRFPKLNPPNPAPGTLVRVFSRKEKLRTARSRS